MTQTLVLNFKSSLKLGFYTNPRFTLFVIPVLVLWLQCSIINIYHAVRFLCRTSRLSKSIFFINITLAVLKKNNIDDIIVKTICCWLLNLVS